MPSLIKGLSPKYFILIKAAMSQNNLSEVNMFSFEALNLPVGFAKLYFSERGWIPVFFFCNF